MHSMWMRRWRRRRNSGVHEVTRRFVITGKVQGVYFRHSTRAEAQRLGIAGVARNLADGTVEVIAQGSSAAVEQLREWLHRGPPLARVAGVQELDTPESASARHADTDRYAPASGWVAFGVE